MPPSRKRLSMPRKVISVNPATVLCPELLEACVAFLQPPELCRAAAVNKRFRRAALSARIWLRHCAARWKVPESSDFRDDVMGLAFHRLYPLIGDTPTGFDLSLAQPSDEIKGSFKGSCNGASNGAPNGAPNGFSNGGGGCKITLEAAFTGRVGMGNRCVRTDFPLPPTFRPPQRGPLDAAALAALRWLSRVRRGACSTRQAAAAGEKVSLAEAKTSCWAPISTAMALPGGGIDVSPRLTAYFEVTVLEPRGRHGSSFPFEPVPDCIAVGLSRQNFGQRLGRRMPGWCRDSYGFHSDDGGIFHDAGSMVCRFAPSFGPGDVVGCGIDFGAANGTGDIFFTLNGRWLGVAFRGVRGALYPTVGLDSTSPVRINLGGETPFAFDLAEHARAHRQKEVLTWGLLNHL